MNVEDQTPLGIDQLLVLILGEKSVEKSARVARKELLLEFE